MHAKRLAKSSLMRWAHYFADGKRSIRDIVRLYNGMNPKPVTIADGVEFFTLYEEFGFVRLKHGSKRRAHR